MSRRGTYSQGFAPRDYQPAYPSLWRGCVGAWCPSLGPTGATLLDWSPFKNHGTLTGFTLANAWPVSEGCYALQTDGINDFVDCGQLGAIDGISKQTFSVWVKRSASNKSVDIGKRNMLAYNNISLYGDGVLYAQCYPAYGFVAVAGTEWTHIVTVLDLSQSTDATKMRVWVNGTQASLGFAGTLPSTTPAAGNFELGREGGPALYSTGFIDDVRVYTRVLNTNEIKLLSLRRGIAYEPARKRYASIGGAILVPYYHLLGASA